MALFMEIVMTQKKNNIYLSSALTDTTRIRQSKKDKNHRINQTQSLDMNNEDLNVSNFEL